MYEDVVEFVKQKPVRDELKEPPTDEEVLEALGMLKVKKAGGKNGLLQEMVKSCGAALIEYIKDLFGTVWKEKVPAAWKRCHIGNHSKER